MIGVHPHRAVPLPTTFIFVSFTTIRGMPQQRKSPGLDKGPTMDEAKVHALRQYNDTDGHFSLVRFVDDAARDLTKRGPGPLLTSVDSV